MANTPQHVWTAAEPEYDEKPMRYVRLDGWVRMTTQGRQGKVVQVEKIETVRFLNREAHEYTKDGKKFYYDGYRTYEGLSEDEATALLGQQGQKHEEDEEHT